MGYAIALERAWEDALASSGNGNPSIRFLSDTYEIDAKRKTVFSASASVPAKDYVTILVLHYFTSRSRLGGIPPLTNEWIDFNNLEGGEGYYPAFMKRTIDQVLKKFGPDPDSLLNITSRMPAEKAESGDTGVIIKPFEGVPIMITMWKADDEFGPSANILFDKNISLIFCTEDIVVLTEYVVHQL